MNKQPRTTISVKQGIAAAALVEGRSINEAARAAGVHRVTVSNWTRSDPIFIASLNKSRDELLREHGDLLRMIRSEALALVRTAVENGNLKAALEVLRLTSRGTAEVLQGVGPSDPKVVELAFILRDRIQREASGESGLSRSGRRTAKPNTKGSASRGKGSPKEGSVTDDVKGRRP